jgi:DNA-binding transcriptional ArsR family regulator
MPSGAPEEPDLRRPSLVQLRLRALVGVSARAEILRLLLADGERPKSVSALAEGAAYGKGSVAQALELLTRTGIIQMQPSGNRLLYSLAQPAEIRLALKGLPGEFPDWAPILRITEALAAYAGSTPSSSSARVTRLRHLLHAIDDDVRRLGIAGVVPTVSGPESVSELEQWAVTFIADHAGTTQVPLVRDATYIVEHLRDGGWTGSTHDRGRPPRQLEPSGRPSGGSLADESGPHDLALAIFDDVLGRKRQMAGRESGTSAIQATSRAFADQELRAIERGRRASFSGEFLRRWFENRRPQA